MHNHQKFMRVAIREARRGIRRVSPNPAVGCVIVKENKIIARGYHKNFGAPHAETEALKDAGDAAEAGTLYVTLEPCCHSGKTPPCTEAIIESGIKEVVAAMPDPNPANNGRGLKQLRKNGIRVISGVLRREAEELNRGFIERMKKKRPYISVKIAQSLDGKIATRIGDSKWVSSQGSREIVHRLRSRHDAIMVGVNTVVRDNPFLNVRRRLQVTGNRSQVTGHRSQVTGNRSQVTGNRSQVTGNRSQVTGHRSQVTGCRSWQPVKVVVDSSLRTPTEANIFGKDSPAKVIIATTKKATASKEKNLRSKGADILRLRSNSGQTDLPQLVKELGKKGIQNILVEGGGELVASLFAHKLVDKIFFFVSPKIVGGRDAITSVEGKGIRSIKDAYRLSNVKVKRIKDDILVEAEVDEPQKR